MSEQRTGDELQREQQFAPTPAELAMYGSYTLERPLIIQKPRDVPEDYIAYNPSSIWTVREPNGSTRDILYARVEPSRSDSHSSHLGHARVRPYIINPLSPLSPLVPYDVAQEFTGEDAALTRITRKLPLSGKQEEIWLLSYVDARPKVDIPNEVGTLCTRFWAGTNLAKLEHVADGPEWMKDIRVKSLNGVDGTRLAVYGRPQTQPQSGNITYGLLPDIESLNADSIANLTYIDEKLLPVGSGVWGGVNDVFSVAPYKHILAAHRAHRSKESNSLHYEAVLYGHNIATNHIVELGVIAIAPMFAGGVVKDDTTVNLSDVVFTGGGYNGRLEYMTFGVSDGNIGIAALRTIRR